MSKRSIQRGETVGIFSMNRLECKIYEGFENQLFWRFDRYECVVSSRTIGIYSFFRSTKKGEEEIKYDLDACEEYLGEKPTELPFTKSR
jgi:DNA polymerase-3 subunit alpha